MDEIISEMPPEMVICDEEVASDLNTQNDLLQLLALGREQLDSKKEKWIISSDDIDDILWAEDVRHNLDPHSNLLEQFTHVMHGQGGNNFVTGVRDSPLVPQSDEISEVQEMKPTSENLVSGGEKQGASDLQLVIDGMQAGCVVLGNTQSWGFDGGFCLGTMSINYGRSRCQHGLQVKFSKNMTWQDD